MSKLGLTGLVLLAAVLPAAVEAQQFWQDSFDAYATGTPIAGQGDGRPGITTPPPTRSSRTFRPSRRRTRCACVSACTTPGAVPGQIVNIGGSEVPGIGSAPLPTDQWFQIWVVYNLPGFGYNYAVGLNGSIFTPFQPWGVTAPGVFKAVNLFSNNSSATYVDDSRIEQFVPVELMTFSVE